MTEIHRSTVDFGRRVVDDIVERQAERRASVAAAHGRNTVWCCASDAEECFDDLDTLLRCLGLVQTDGATP